MSKNNIDFKLLRVFLIIALERIRYRLLFLFLHIISLPVCKQFPRLITLHNSLVLNTCSQFCTRYMCRCFDFWTSGRFFFFFLFATLDLCKLSLSSTTVKVSRDFVSFLSSLFIVMNNNINNTSRSSKIISPVSSFTDFLIVYLPTYSTGIFRQSRAAVVMFFSGYTFSFFIIFFFPPRSTVIFLVLVCARVYYYNLNAWLVAK